MNTSYPKIVDIPFYYYVALRGRHSQKLLITGITSIYVAEASYKIFIFSMKGLHC